MLEFRHVSTGRSSCPVLYRASTSFFPVSLKSRREWPGIGERKQRRPSDGYARRWRHLFVFVSNPSDQVLFCDDLTEPAVIRNEFLDEFMHAMLEITFMWLLSKRLRTPRAWRCAAPWRP